MAKITDAVVDAGPFIHLHEIELMSLFGLFKRITTSGNILEECHKIRNEIKELKNLDIKKLTSTSKDFTKYLIQKYKIDMGEASGIALCRQENIELFFTDDLEARSTANHLGFEARGSIAIILRSLRENMLSKDETKDAIKKLYHDSSLFMTEDLKDWTLREIDNFKG